MKSLTHLLLACGLLLAHTAQAMDFEVQGDTVFASGPLGDDMNRFDRAIATPGVKRVVFVNSPGGDLWTALYIGQTIVDRKLETVVAGYCMSACSIMFMGGVERTFSDAFSPAETLIGVHGPHDKNNRSVASGPTPRIYAFLKAQMGERFNSEVINKALHAMDDAGALLRVYDPQREEKRNTHHCRAGNTPRKECENLKDADAFTLGFVTQTKLTKLVLPEALRAQPLIAGRRLTQLLADPEGYLDEVAAQKCSSDGCRKLLPAYAAAPGHKAVATAVSGTGVGTAYNRASAAEAYVGALNACNHIKDRPIRLCEVQVVDGYDLRGEYARDQALAAEALGRLAVPPLPYYASEEQVGTVPAGVVSGSQGVAAPTPVEIKGIKTYATQELARDMKGGTPPVIVDVWGALISLPSAQTLVKGGIAYADPAKESAYAERFAGLLRLLAPDPSAPLVFVGKGRDSWFALNAALRAKKLGYTAVGWYRGGLDSWQAAGLPFAVAVIRALVEP